MRGSGRRIFRLLLRATILSLLCLTPVDAEGPTLVRLSINWLPTDKLDALEAMYDRQLEPIFARHGLASMEKWSRQDSAFSIFCSHFAVESPAVAIAQMRAVREDPAWEEAIQRLGAAIYGKPDRALEYRLHIHHTPAGAGKSVRAGAGKSVEAGRGTTVEIGSGFGQGLWQNFGLVDGMPHTIATMLQDRRGDLWFATSDPGPNLGWPDGLWRYDGLQPYRFNTADGLPHDAVTCLLEDRSGQLWIGSKGGLTRYDDRQDVGETFTTFTTEDGLAHNTVICLLEDRSGRLWIGSDSGLTRYDGETFTTFTTEDGMAHDRVACLLEDSKEQLWFGAGWSAGGPVGLGRYDGRSFTQFTTADGLSSDWVLSLLEDESGQLWIGTNGSVNRYDDRQDVGEIFERVFATDFRQYLGGVMAMLQDRTGDLFFAIWGEGLRRFDGTDYLSLTPRDGLASTSVLSLLEDRDGQLWIGSANGELSRYKNQRLATFGREDGLTHDNIYSLFEDREGRLWIGTIGGMSWYDARQDAGERFAVLETPEKGVGNILQDRRGHLWFGLGGLGAGRYDGRRFELFEKEGIHFQTSMKPLLEDGQGRLWFATGGENGGIDLFDGEQWTTFDGNIGLAHENVVCMHQDRAGNLWFGSWGEGVSRYDGEQFERFTAEDGLAHDEVFDILEDPEGNLWFATSGGVSRYDGRSFANLTTEDGLTYDNVFSMMQDREGKLWFATQGGVSLYDGRVVQHLTRKDGLANDSIREIIQDRHGAIWIAANGGLNRYLPSSTPPAVRLQSIVADQRYGPTEEIFGFEQTAETIRKGCREGHSAEGLIDRLLTGVKTFTKEEPQGDDMTVVVLKVEA
ncbi:MAG: SpoIIE family protein phosphatase [Gemmatimonadetes bacterium]|nr:SpoIIE family protein phosphatase [Gemmatimonadota bacterium]